MRCSVRRVGEGEGGMGLGWVGLGWKKSVCVCVWMSVGVCECDRDPINRYTVNIITLGFLLVILQLTRRLYLYVFVKDEADTGS